MPSAWQVGQSVKHPQFGVGRVESVLSGGEKLRVYFSSIATAKTIAASFLGGGQTVAPRGPAPSSRPHVAPAAPAGGGEPPGEPPEEQIKARLAVECLRQGLPPPGGVKAWTVGLKDVQSRIGAALDDASSLGKGSLVVVEGGYGQGKSHIGRWARELALSRQIATMNAELDGGGISLANSSRLLAYLFASLRVPNGNGAGDPVPGLGTLLREAARSGRGVPRGCEDFGPFLGNAGHWEGNEEAIEVLEEYLGAELAKNSAETRLAGLGLPLSLPALRLNWGTLAARLVAQARQLARVVALARASGAKAGLIVIDELDHEFADHNAQRSLRAFETIKAWNKEFSREPIVLVLLAPTGITGWPACRRVALPLLTGPELKCLTAKVVEAYRKAKAEIIVRDAVDRLFGRLLDDFNSRFRDEGWGPRYFVRATVEACERAVEKRAPLDSVLG